MGDQGRSQFVNVQIGGGHGKQHIGAGGESLGECNGF